MEGQLGHVSQPHRLWNLPLGEALKTMSCRKLSGCGVGATIPLRACVRACVWTDYLLPTGSRDYAALSTHCPNTKARNTCLSKDSFYVFRLKRAS